MGSGVSLNSKALLVGALDLSTLPEPSNLCFLKAAVSTFKVSKNLLTCSPLFFFKTT
jgi:hypothetical protein